MVKHVNSGVYQILNKENNKVYIGSTNNFKKRRKQHFYLLRSGKHGNSYLQDSWNKYGEDSFEFNVVEIVEDQDNLIEREQYYIDTFKSYNNSFGYNLKRYAKGMKDFTHKDETKDKMRKSKLKELNSFFGKTHTEKAKDSIRKSNRGEGASKSKLKESDVLEIYKLLSLNNMKIKDIATKFNVAPNTITQIKNGTNWSHLYHLFDGKRDSRYKSNFV
jgi:group I intron endonuclease